jgi:flagellar motor switch protein FliM
VKPERAFIADRVAAQHCAELMRSGTPALELAPALIRALPHLEAALASRIGAMTGGDVPKVSAEPPRELLHADFASEVPALAGICALSTGHAAPFLAVIDAGAVFGFVDRAFGGQGQCPDPLPDAFPLSAELMLARIEDAVCAAVHHALGAQGASAPRAMARGGRIALVSPLDAAEMLSVLRLTVIGDALDPWRITLAFPAAALGALLQHDSAVPVSPIPGSAADADPLAEPFGSMPLPLTATLVDMRVPFSAIARLRPGDVLPVAVARSVPLSVGGQTIAHGTIGEVDDRVAVRLTQIF